MDAISVTPVPGDPSQEDYEDLAPPLDTPFIFALGTVQSADGVDDQGRKRCTIQVTERVREAKKTSNLQCIFAGNPARWSTLSVPNPQASIYVVGTCSGFRAPNTLLVDLENITFNALAPTPTVGGGPPTPPAPGAKRRKFAAFASPVPATPSPAADSSSAATPPVASSSATTLEMLPAVADAQPVPTTRTRNDKRKAQA